MKLFHVGWLAAGVCLGGVAVLLAEPPNVGELTQELVGERPAATRPPEQLEAVYAQVLEPLLPDLGSEDPGKRNGPQGTIERIAFRAGRPGAEADRAACSKALAARLGSGQGALARVWLLRQLERIGRDEVVPALVACLADTDEQVRESARRALQQNPARAAGAALQQAIRAAEAPAWRAALVNALSARREPAALKLLLKEAGSEHADVRCAALIGLARLGDKAAVKPLAAALNQGSPLARVIAADACLRLADALVENGEKSAALRIYKQQLTSAGHHKCAAIVGLGRAGDEDELPTLFEALADPDATIGGAAVEALCLLDGRKVAGAIAGRFKTAPPAVRLGLLQALARRGDKGAGDTFLAAAGDTNETVRTVALAGLGTVGHAAAVPVLLNAAASAGPAQSAARQSLLTLPGADTDQVLLGALKDGKEPPIRVEAIRALASRHAVAATPALLAAADAADGGVRNEALKALGVVAPSSALAGVAAILAKTADDATRNEAAAALVKIASREADVEGRSQPVLDALAAAGAPARLALLGVLGRIGGAKSLVAVHAAVQDADEKVKDAAIRALAEWPDAAAAGELLAVAQSAASETHQVLATRGYIRVCRIRVNRPDAESAKLLAAGLAAARRPDEKREALGGLAEVRDILALQAVVPCLDDEPIREEAASAAVRIGREIWNQQPAAVQAAMQKVLAVTRDDNRKREARETLDRAEQKLKEAKP